MDASTLKTELKRWERDFEVTFGRKATLEDIKQDEIVAKYRLHRQLSQSHSKFLPNKSPPLPLQHQPSTSANPFASPRKQSRAPGTPDASTSKARKRLRGELVSPSPSKDIKKRRLLRQWQDHEQDSDSGNSDDNRTTLAFASGTPAKPSGRLYHPLFGEASTSTNLFESFASSHQSGDSNWRNERSTLVKSHSFSRDKSTLGRDIVPDPQDRQRSASKESNPPSPILAPQRSNKVKETFKEVGNGTRNLSDNDQVKVVEWQGHNKQQMRPSRSGEILESNGPPAIGLMREARLPDPEPTKVDVRLPEDLQRILSLRDSQIAAKMKDDLEDRLAGDLIRGRYICDGRGADIWEAGESIHTDGEMSGDEWDESGQEWAGEL